MHTVLLVVAVGGDVCGRSRCSRPGAAAWSASSSSGRPLAVPILLDLWAVVAADPEGIRWRNRLVRRRLAWAAVAGFEREPTSMALRRADGRLVPLRALGLRYLGSKRLAAERIRALERLRISAFRSGGRGRESSPRTAGGVMATTLRPARLLRGPMAGARDLPRNAASGGIESGPPTVTGPLR